MRKSNKIDPTDRASVVIMQTTNMVVGLVLSSVAFMLRITINPSHVQYHGSVRLSLLIIYPHVAQAGYRRRSPFEAPVVKATTAGKWL